MISSWSSYHIWVLADAAGGATVGASGERWSAWRGTNTGWDGSINSATNNDAPMPIPTPAVASSVTSFGGLHHISCGIGDGNSGWIPQTLHTIRQGISA